VIKRDKKDSKESLAVSISDSETDGEQEHEDGQSLEMHREL